MCGLLFAFDADRPPDALREAAQAGLRRLAHRGPDAEGLRRGDGWVLGHRRLSIIDLAASEQPMEAPEHGALLAYNGEVYNYRELRGALAPRWRFRTVGDTEVLLAGLCLEGVDFLSKAEGMWALALWQPETRHLLLARDRMGKKPLYLAARGASCYVASELPALLRMLPAIPDEDLDSTADYLRYGWFLPGHTIYCGVQEVLPGHWLQWQPDAPTATESYWTLPVGGWRGARRADAAAETREALRAAVRRRLVADVEVGAFLSGGIDSSILCALAVPELERTLKTFTIGFGDPSFDESSYARSVAAFLRTDHHERPVGVPEPAQLFRLLEDHVGQPFADSSLLPTAAVAEVAAAHVKVALSGDGGDELFCGYQRYLGRVLLRWYSRLPRSLRGTTERVVRALPEPMAHHSRSLLKKAHLFVDIVERGAAGAGYIAPLLYDRRTLPLLAPSLAQRGHAPPALPDRCDLDDVTEMMCRDALVYLPQDILLKVDRATMAHSLEARAPFLDRRVVELAFSLPSHHHRHGLQGKRLLRDAFGDSLPAAVWQRRKQGFGVPVHQWYRDEYGRELDARLQRYEGLLERGHIRELLSAHRNGRRDNGHRLFHLDAYVRWADQAGSVAARD
jgi:asparagine synthase (glutamine-hydrolysing)